MYRFNMTLHFTSYVLYVYIFYILCVAGLRYEFSAYKAKTPPSGNNFLPPTFGLNIPQLIFRVMGRCHQGRIGLYRWSFIWFKCWFNGMCNFVYSVKKSANTNLTVELIDTHRSSIFP